MTRSSRLSLLCAAAGLLAVSPAAMAAETTSEPPASAVVTMPVVEQSAQGSRDELKQWLKLQRIQSLATRPAPRGDDQPAPTPPRPPVRPPKLQCTQAALRTYVRRYTLAFNRGKVKPLRQFFAARSVETARAGEGGLVVVDGNARGFRWYTVSATRRGLTKSARRFFLGRKRNQVLRYVVNRRKRGERLRFVTVTGFESLQIGAAPHAGVAFLVRRRANDLLPRKRWRTVKGKALIDCQSGKISAFSLE